MLLDSEKAFTAYSYGMAVVPQVGYMQFNDPPGEVHIKYGFITNQKYHVVKIASGFYQNSSLNLSSGMGIILVYSQCSGELEHILLDEG